MKTLSKVWNFLKGKKTYVFAAMAVVLGIHLNSAELVMTGLVAAGLRHGLSTDITKVLLSNDPVTTAKQDAPAIVADVVAGN